MQLHAVWPVFCLLPEGISEEVDALKGHGFSRAESRLKQMRALAPEGSFQAAWIFAKA
jgi:hypothetical protein